MDQNLSILADLARWIWDQAAVRFKGKDVQWVVDIYHLMLYLFAAAAELGTQKAESWVGQRIIELIEMGGPKFIAHLQNIGPPNASCTTAAAWGKLLHHLNENRDTLWYGQRLSQGLPHRQRLNRSRMRAGPNLAAEAGKSWHGTAAGSIIRPNYGINRSEIWRHLGG